ncbi:MAG: hypothetical protein AAFV19_15185 [Pseudomonadota bacterium]
MSSVVDTEQLTYDDRVLEGVRLPLENIEFTIEQFLLDHGARLDTETRCLLAGVRDGVRRVAIKARDARDFDGSYL